jgi:hypothetical protein
LRPAHLGERGRGPDQEQDEHRQRTERANGSPVPRHR